VALQGAAWLACHLQQCKIVVGGAAWRVWIKVNDCYDVTTSLHVALPTAVLLFLHDAFPAVQLNQPHLRVWGLWCCVAGLLVRLPARSRGLQLPPSCSHGYDRDTCPACTAGGALVTLQSIELTEEQQLERAIRQSMDDQHRQASASGKLRHPAHRGHLCGGS
jgi:hypothetical protein